MAFMLLKSVLAVAVGRSCCWRCPCCYHRTLIAPTFLLTLPLLHSYSCWRPLLQAFLRLLASQPLLASCCCLRPCSLFAFLLLQAPLLLHSSLIGVAFGPAVAGTPGAACIPAVAAVSTVAGAPSVFEFSAVAGVPIFCCRPAIHTPRHGIVIFCSPQKCITVAD